ncbi:MAG: LPS assembly lipoprotein LptE [Bacteroidota bacterium]
MIYNKKSSFILVLLIALSVSGCFRYSFTGASIPDDVDSIYIPFFADQSSGGVGNLSDLLNDALVNRFVNQTRLQLANSREDADAVLEGSVVSYANEAFSVSGEGQNSLNEVTISVRATFQYVDEEEAEWSSTFSGSETYDTNENPIDGETNAAIEALNQVADNMFNDAVSDW